MLSFITNEYLLDSVVTKNFMTSKEFKELLARNLINLIIR
jgi:hypothetical protein